MSKKKGKTGARRDTGHASCSTMRNSQGKAVGGRPKGSVAPPGETQVRKAVERILIVGSKKFQNGELGPKELGDLGKVLDGYCQLLKRTGGDSDLTREAALEEIFQNGRKGAYEEMAFGHRVKEKPSRDPLDGGSAHLPGDEIPDLAEVPKSIEGQDEEAELLEECQRESEDFFAITPDDEAEEENP